MYDILNFIRGVVRPIALIGGVGTTLGLAVVGELEGAKFTAGYTAPFIAWWFADRSNKRQG